MLFFVFTTSYVRKNIMYVRVEVNNERQFVKVDDTDTITFHEFVTKGLYMIFHAHFV